MHKYFNPWKNEKCLSWALDNDDEFLDNILSNEVYLIRDYLLEHLGDQITYNDGGQSKEWAWVNKNYDDLEFEISYYPSCYYSNHEGEWQEFEESYLEKLHGIKYDFHKGIDIGCIYSMQGDIELQCENGDIVYTDLDGHFKLFARVA